MLRDEGYTSRTMKSVERLKGRRVIVNPTSGERIEIVTSGVETGGALLVFDLELPPGAQVPARHVHPEQSERFTVMSGRIRFEVGRERRVVEAGPGETVEVPPGVAHWFGNVGTGPARARVEARPALRLAELFEASEAMGPPRRLFGVVVPPLRELAVFMLEFRREIAAPGLPAGLVHALLAPLAWLGRRTRRAEG